MNCNIWKTNEERIVLCRSLHSLVFFFLLLIAVGIFPVQPVSASQQAIFTFEYVDPDAPKKPEKKADIQWSDRQKVGMLAAYFVHAETDLKPPELPAKPKMPRLPKSETLVKGEFETTTAFKSRIERAKKKRTAQIEKLEKSYARKVQAYNKEVKRLTDAHNVKVKALRVRLPQIEADAMVRAYGAVYGAPRLDNLRYDADTEQFFADLTSTRGGFREQVVIKMPLRMARRFKEDAPGIKPEVVFIIQDNKMLLKKVIVPWQKMNYTAMLTEASFKPVAMTRTLEKGTFKFEDAKLLDSTFSAAKSDYDIGSVDYGIDPSVAKLTKKDFQAMQQARLEKFNEGIDDLPKLLEKSKPAPANPKAYAIIFGIEDYMLESNVPFSKNSALMFAQYAQKLLGVPEEHIWLLVGSDKTTSGFIKSQWRDFLSAIDAGSTVYFYYSGHGVPNMVDGSPSLLPRDMSAEAVSQESLFKLQNIYQELSATRAKHVIAFVDSCFSGKDSSGKLLFDGVAPVMRTKKVDFDSAKMTIFTAGASNEFANDYKARRERLFSYYLMRGMAASKLEAKALHDYVKSNVSRVSRKKGAAYKQVPQLMGNPNVLIRVAP